MSSAFFKYSILRIPGVYATDASDNSAFSKIYKRLFNNEEIMLYNGGKSLRDVVEVTDFARCILEIFNCNEEIGVLNIASGVSVPMKDIVFAMAKHMQSKSSIKIIDADDSRGFDIIFDCTKLQTLFPDFYFTPILENIHKFSRKI